ARRHHDHQPHDGHFPRRPPQPGGSAQADGLLRACFSASRSSRRITSGVLARNEIAGTSQDAPAGNFVMPGASRNEGRQPSWPSICSALETEKSPGCSTLSSLTTPSSTIIE